MVVVEADTHDGYRGSKGGRGLGFRRVSMGVGWLGGAIRKNFLKK